MNHIDSSHFDQYEGIIDKYMPNTGEGDNAASQAVTAVNKLIYKWYNDGDVYDNTYNLEGWWNDISSYANWLRKYADAAEILDRIETITTEDEYEELLADLAEAILNESAIQELLSKYGDSTVGSIYNCDGPYKWENRDLDEESFDDRWADDEEEFWDEDEYGDREDWENG